ARTRRSGWMQWVPDASVRRGNRCATPDAAARTSEMVPAVVAAQARTAVRDARSFYNLVGSVDKRFRHFLPDGIGRQKIDHQFENTGLPAGNFGSYSCAQQFDDCPLPISLLEAWPICQDPNRKRGHTAAACGVLQRL